MENLPRAVRPEGGSSPRPTQLRIEGRTGIVVLFSEEISRDELEAALAASGIKVTRPANRNKAEIPLTLAPVLERGPKARREWVLTLGEEPAAGEQVELLLDKWSVMDGFLNHPEEDLHFATTWPTTSATSRHILEDTDPPRVDLVVALDGHLEIELSEAPDEATLASAIRLNGQPHAVTVQADGFTLRSGQPLPLGDHLLEIETTLRDRAGRPLEQRFDAAFTWDGKTPALGIFKAESDTTPTNLLRRSRADKDLIADLTGLNLGFQGQPYDPETGLYYFRNRYYDPELGRFITADPLGYVDGPSLYAFAGNDPVNGRDPLGLREPTPEDQAVQKALEERLFEFDWAFAETDYAEAVVLESGFKNAWWKPGEYEPFFRWEVQAASDLTSYRTLRGRLLRDLDTFVAAVAEADDDGEIDYFRGRYFTYTRAERAANDRAAWALAPIVVSDAIAMFGGPFAKAPPGELRMQARRVETGRGARGVLPDSAIVCRGGTCTAERFTAGSGVTLDSAGRLQGVSVNSGSGLTLEQLSAGIPNRQVGVTLVGEVRRAGGDVLASPTPNNPYHCTLCGITPQQAERLMTPTIRNPHQ